MPDGLTVPGPVQVDRAIQTTQAISEKFTLLGRSGSTVEQGTIQIIPVKDSLLYIQPVYVVSENGGQPAFRFVIVFYNGEAKFGATIEDALGQFPQFRGRARPSTGNGTTPPPTTANSTVDDLLKQANAAYAARRRRCQGASPTSAPTRPQVKKLGDILSQLETARQPAPGTSTSSGSLDHDHHDPSKSKSGTQALGP